MKTKYVTGEGFLQMLRDLSREERVFVARKDPETGHINYAPFDESKPFEYTGFRPVAPTKPFLFEAKEKVAQYWTKEEPTAQPAQRVVLVGPAACDLAAIRALDAVFLSGDFQDVFYQRRRDHTTLISMECTEPRETCFCTSIGGAPHAEEGFDLNVFAVGGGFLVDVGSVRGDALAQRFSSSFREPTKEMLAGREKARGKAAAVVRDYNRGLELPPGRKDLLDAGLDSDAWAEHVRTCVECSACIYACPTCHCFNLYDQAAEGHFERLKAWDSCAYAGFARMAGGGSPMPRLLERFRHRYLHKLSYFPANFDLEACSGCGRCIQACPGKIDMRKVIRAVAESRSTVEQAR
jgi:NAD-dependent dihydropyrimidine dehydrogenase PreA subunit